MEKAKFKDFPPVSKEDWLSKIKKEYRGNQPLESLYRNNGELVWHPFHHPSNAHAEFEVQAFPPTFSTGIVYTNEMPEEQLISSLEAGASIIYIDSICEWKSELGKKIRWDFIQSVIIDNPSFFDKMNEACERDGLTVNKNVLHTTADKILIINLDDFLSGNKQIKELKNEMQSMEHIDLVLFKLGDAFLFNIGFMRGIVQFMAEKSVKSWVLAACSTDDSADVASLISETTQVISARLAGVPNVLLSNSDSDSVAYYKSMIPNILDYESELKFEQDPISGSQYLDHISLQVCNLLK